MLKFLIGVDFLAEVECHGCRGRVGGVVAGAVDFGCGVGENACHTALEVDGILFKGKTGGVENHALCSELESRAGVAHAILSGTEGVGLVAFGRDTEYLGCDEATC